MHDWIHIDAFDDVTRCASFDMMMKPRILQVENTDNSTLHIKDRKDYISVCYDFLLLGKELTASNWCILCNASSKEWSPHKVKFVVCYSSGTLFPSFQPCLGPRVTDACIAR